MKEKEIMELGKQVKFFGTVHSSLFAKNGELMARMYKCKYTYGYLYAIFVYFDDVPEKLIQVTSTEMNAVDRMIEITGQLAA